MGKRIVEGLWDCPYCKAKAIGGLTKHCPQCGHPQDTGTRFYLGEKKNYLDDQLAAEYGQGADWVCPYCGSLNRIRFKYCANCAAPKSESTADYFSQQKQESGPQSPPDRGGNSAQGAPGGKQAPAQTPANRSEGPSGGAPDRSAGAARQAAGANRTASSPGGGTQAGRRRLGKRSWIALGIVLLVAALLFAYWPRTYTAQVSVRAWAREIDIEAWRTVRESDWDVPNGGRVYDERQEFHHFVRVLDHYETRTRTVSEQVYDGEDYYTSYSDNGDGTFTEETYSSPRYRTEYYTETYEEPVYRNDPVYATKYYYEIEKWVVDREEESSGADSEPYWPEYTLAENERTGFMGEAYALALRVDDEQYTVFLPLERWETFQTGDTVEITVVAGDVTKIDGEGVEEEE